MKLTPMFLGRPGEHGAVSHMLKHYVRPGECWEDVPGDVPARFRPMAVATEVGREAWLKYQDEGFLKARWGFLVEATRGGYLELVMALAEALEEPPGTDWVKDLRGHCLTHAGHGVILVVRCRRGEYVMYTAFRPADFHYSDHDHAPRDARQRKLRLEIAALKARHYLARRREPMTWASRPESHRKG